MAYSIKKGELSRFIEAIISNYEVIAPIKKDIVRFQVLKSGQGKDVVFNTPIYSAKEYFLPIKERMIEFKGDKINEVQEPPKRRVFFMNRCDVNAVHRNDLIMLNDPQDPYYKQKRDNAYLIEIPCVHTSQCTCADIALIDCYDIRLILEKDKFMIDVKTEKGEEIIERTRSRVNFKKEEHIKTNFSEFVPKKIITDNKDVWDKYEKECLSCSACTVVCPTCMCFTIDGQLNMDIKSGSLHREWGSCQLTNFTKVAGGHVFRRERGARGRQRIHCKFIYFKEKFGFPRCVGCGRCNAACPVGINIYEYYNMLK